MVDGLLRVQDRGPYTLNLFVGNFELLGIITGSWPGQIRVGFSLADLLHLLMLPELDRELLPQSSKSALLWYFHRVFRSPEVCEFGHRRFALSAIMIGSLPWRCSARFLLLNFLHLSVLHQAIDEYRPQSSRLFGTIIKFVSKCVEWFAFMSMHASGVTRSIIKFWCPQSLRDQDTICRNILRSQRRESWVGFSDDRFLFVNIQLLSATAGPADPVYVLSTKGLFSNSVL